MIFLNILNFIGLSILKFIVVGMLLLVMGIGLVFIAMGFSLLFMSVMGVLTKALQILNDNVN